jgi:hypothetical protein
LHLPLQRADLLLPALDIAALEFDRASAGD